LRKARASQARQRQRRKRQDLTRRGRGGLAQVAQRGRVWLRRPGGVAVASRSRWPRAGRAASYSADPSLRWSETAAFLAGRPRFRASLGLGYARCSSSEPSE